MGKEKFDIILAFAVTSAKELMGVEDLLDSARVYFPHKNSLAVIIDNSADAAFGKELKRICSKYENTKVIANEARQDMYGGLYYSISKAMLYALENYTFRAFVKLDTDSLITGPGLERDVIAYFDKNPEIGLLGAYKLTPTGAPRDFSGWAQRVERDKQPWEKYLLELKGKDYITAEHAQGGGCIFSVRVVQALAEQNLLALDELRVAGVAEDVTFSTVTRYAGFRIGDFCADHQPLAISWRGLPYSVIAIRKKKKKLIHSLKFGPEDRLRRLFFRVCRRLDHQPRSNSQAESGAIASGKR